MEDNIENDVEFTADMFDNSLKILEKKNKDKYKFILQGGADLKLALFKLTSSASASTSTSIKLSCPYFQLILPPSHPPTYPNY